MQRQRVNKNHIPGVARVLDHLQWNAVSLLDIPHEPYHALLAAPRRVEVADVRMRLQQLAKFSAPRIGWRRMVREPFVHEAMRAADHQGAASVRFHVAKQCEQPCAGWWGEGAQIIRIDVPA